MQWEFPHTTVIYAETTGSRANPDSIGDYQCDQEVPGIGTDNAPLLMQQGRNKIRQCTGQGKQRGLLPSLGPQCQPGRNKRCMDYSRRPWSPRRIWSANPVFKLQWRS